MNRAGQDSDRAPIDAESRRKLWQAFARSIRDNAMAEFAVQILRVAGMVVLARALTPTDFGLLKVLIVITIIAGIASEVGIPDALVQRRTLTPQHEASALWLSTGLGLLTGFALFFFAPGIARLMDMPQLSFGIRLLCVPILMDSTTAPANARLRRELRFGALALADVMAETAFLVTAIVLLWIGRPDLSLPAALGARFAAHALTIWIVDARVPTVMPTIAAIRDFARFAMSVLGGQVTIALSANIDYLLVGRFLGSATLGFYSIAWDLLRFFPFRLHKIAVRVTFPAFCRLQDDDEALARAYQDFFNYVARIVLPVLACMAIAAPELISTVYGRRWLPAAVPLRLLAGGLTLAGLREGTGTIFYAKDHPSFDIMLNGVRLVLIVAVIWMLKGYGIFGISAGMSVVEGAISVAGMALAAWLINTRLRDLMIFALPGLRLAGLCVMATLAGKLIAHLAELEGVVALALMVLLPAVTLCWIEGATMSRMVGAAFVRADAPAAAS
jgi:PST family polysaccharide transporter